MSEIVITKDELEKALVSLRGSVSKNGLIPAYSNYMFKRGDKGKLTIKASNGDKIGVYKTEVDYPENGIPIFFLQADNFEQLVAAFEGNEIKMKPTERGVKIENSTFKAEIVNKEKVSESNYPKEDDYKIDPELFIEADFPKIFQYVGFSMSEIDLRISDFTFSGIHGKIKFDAESKSIIAVFESSDSYRFARLTGKISTSPKLAKELESGKVLDFFFARDITDDVVRVDNIRRVEFSQNLKGAKIGDRKISDEGDIEKLMFYSNIPEFKFPDYESIVSRDVTAKKGKQIVIDKDAFTKVLERVSYMCDEEFDTRYVFLEREKDTVNGDGKVAAKIGADSGKAKNVMDYLEVEVEEDTVFKFSFTPDFIEVFLEAVEESKIQVNILDKFIVFKIVNLQESKKLLEDQDYLYVVAFKTVNTKK